jgi:phospholipid transport system transporter-binding protein
MSDISIDARAEGDYLLAGALDFASVPSVLDRATEIFVNGATSISIDLSGVTRADSAGLALLVEWMRIAHRHHRNIVFRNIPAQMRAIAKVSGLERILPVEE